jgi:hypothetical protein
VIYGHVVPLRLLCVVSLLAYSKPMSNVGDTFLRSSVLCESMLDEHNTVCD